jgi:acyl-CoA reductase-like NAD-dependent aldehyde dehydrogenase
LPSSLIGPATVVGPVVSACAAQRVSALVKDAVAKGATLLGYATVAGFLSVRRLPAEPDRAWTRT